MPRALLALLFLFSFGLSLAQGLPRVQELEEREVYWFLANRVKEVVSVGLPPKGVAEALKEKRLTLVLGREEVPSWAKGARVHRLGGTPMSGWFLLGDGRFFVAKKEGKYLVLESPETVAVIWGYLSAALLSERR